MSAIPAHLESVLAACRPRDLVEVAFYGGTFTLWPREAQRACLETVRKHFAGRADWRVRCSTRPASFGLASPESAPREGDPLEPRWLRELQQLGMHLVELGVQSFYDAALARAERGYTGAGAAAGCRTVLAAGLGLGVQLMPGMPGVTPEIFLKDVDTALTLGAQCLRFYPCLVIEGTALAALWRRGEYEPWSLEVTIRTLGSALAQCWTAGVPVIRIGLAPGPELHAAVLAGPWHASLGSLVQAEALAQTVEAYAVNTVVSHIVLPKRCQGFFCVQSKAILARWERYGIQNRSVQWHDALEGVIHYTSASPKIFCEEIPCAFSV